MATYATLEQLKARLSIPSEVHTADEALTRELEIASIELDRLTGQEPGGWATDPRAGHAVEATLLDAARLFVRKDSPGSLITGFDSGPVFAPGWDTDYDRLVTSLRLPGSWGIA